MSKLGNRPQAAPNVNPEPLTNPGLPPHPMGEEWAPYATRYWGTVWDSDAVPYWFEADLILLERCLFMVDQMARGEATTATLSELRRTEEALFLSPGSRQRSRINTTAPGSQPSEGERSEQAKVKAELAEQFGG